MDPMPEDVDALAAWIVRQQDPLRLDAGLRRLEPLVRRRARCMALARGLSADEFAGEAFTHVGLQLAGRKFDPCRQQRFRVWLNQVLNRLAIDVLRQRARRERQDPLLDPEDGEFGRASEAVVDEAAEQERRDWDRVYLATDPLTSRDMARIESWPPRERMLVLCLCGWHGRVPGGVWERWRAEAGLTAPFPPSGFSDCEDPHQRVGLLGTLWDCDVAVFWKRKQLRLLELDAWWSLLREHESRAAAWEAEEVAEWERLPPPVRIVLLAVSGLWARLPDWDCWRRWEREAGIGVPVPLLVIARKACLQQRVAALQRHLPKRIEVDVAGLWQAESWRLGPASGWPFPPREGRAARSERRHACGCGELSHGKVAEGEWGR
ncbi:MAG TPA: sigma factor [Candidatus Anammoximicrobium sp.]|nr:sigma factor [Candidatus Anammoximicrobium sp.]